MNTPSLTLRVDECTIAFQRLTDERRSMIEAYQDYKSNVAWALHEAAAAGETNRGDPWLSLADDESAMTAWARREALRLSRELAEWR